MVEDLREPFTFCGLSSPRNKISIDPLVSPSPPSPCLDSVINSHDLLRGLKTPSQEVATNLGIYSHFIQVICKRILKQKLGLAIQINACSTMQKCPLFDLTLSSSLFAQCLSTTNTSINHCYTMYCQLHKSINKLSF